jgi:hypothetical protein
MAMRVGVIMCKIFENEMLHIMKSDGGITDIYVIGTEHTKRLEELLQNSGIEFMIIPSGDDLPPDKTEGLEVVIEVLELGLHVYKEKIRPAVTDCAKKLEPHVDYLLLLYGLCGNALDNIEEDIAKENLHAVIPKDPEGYIIDDCIGVLLGGKRGYWNELRKESGTWFSTSGWSMYGLDILERDLGTKGKGMSKYIIKDVSHYKRVLMVETGVEDPDFKERSTQFAQEMDLRLEGRAGSLDLLIETWNKTKQLAFLRSKDNNATSEA